MSKNVPEIPFREIVERVSQITRSLSENDRSRVRGAINDFYTLQLPAKEDWQPLIATSSLTTESAVRRGTVGVNTQATALTFSSDASLGSSVNGWKIYMTGNGFVYDFTFSNSTGGTINPPLTGTANLSNASYVLFQPIYRLPPDFDRFPKNGGPILYQGGRRKILDEEYYERFQEKVFPSPSTPEHHRLSQNATDGTAQIELRPAPNDPLVLGLEYLKRLSPLRETTGGTVTINASQTSVTGHGSLFTEAQSGWFLRVNAFGQGADSEWYRVRLVTNDTTLTLSSAFGLSGATSAQYSLSQAPEVPVKFHSAILYGAAKEVLLDQTDPLYAVMDSRQTAAILDCRSLYASRQVRPEVPTVMEDFEFRR